MIANTQPNATGTLWNYFIHLSIFVLTQYRLLPIFHHMQLISSRTGVTGMKT